MSKNELPVPDALPTLASGKHEQGAGQACVMEYVSILAGEQFSDHPSCTDAVLAAVARSVNDWMTDDGRQALVPLIGRLFGTAERGSDSVGIQLAEFISAYVHAEIEDTTEKTTDERLINYMTAVLNKFDELTGFNDHESTKLDPAQFYVLTKAVEHAKV